MTAADLIVHGRRVFGHPGASAVACRGDRVIALGPARSLGSLQGPSTRVVEAPDGLICPGFHDAHAHLAPTATAALETDLHDLDVGGIVDALQAAATTRAPGRWVIGRGYDPRGLETEGSTPRALLDATCPQHPVLLRSHDYHSVAVNSAALEALGLVPAVLSAFGEQVERALDGTCNGILREHAAVTASSNAGDLTLEEVCEGVRGVIADLHRHGITAIHEMSGSHRRDVLRTLDDAGHLDIDVFASVSPSDVASAELTRDGRRFHIRGMKTFLDGALGSRTAHMLAPYRDGGDAAHRGMEVLSPADTLRCVGEAAAQGLPAWLHAIGDAAVRSALDAIAAHPGPDQAPLRHRVEHAQMIHEQDLSRFSAGSVVASVQPVHMALDAPLIRCSWGDRSHEAFPLRRLVDAGAPIALGSDTPIETFDVVEGLRCAVQRRARDGSLLHPEEALTVEEAIAGYTSGAAWAAGDDSESGSIAPGKLANLTVFGNDLLAGGDALADAHVSATVYRGSVVHEAGA